MSRASKAPAKAPVPNAPAGQLALVTIGMESILLSSTVAHKLLPLLEKGIAVNAYHDASYLRQVLRDGEPLRVGYRLVDRSELQLDQHGHPVRDGEAP